MHHTITTSAIIICLAFLISQPVQSQDRNDSLIIDLDPIEIVSIRSNISAADAPLALSIKNRSLQEINHDAAFSLTSISNELPGIWVNNRQNHALGEQMTIRGIGWRASFGVRGIQVVLDGIPLTVADGQSVLNIIDPSFIRKAEVIRGPAGAYWGNSSGGVLYLSTRPNYTKDKANIRLQTMTGSFGFTKVQGEASYSTGNHDVSAYTSYLNEDGFRNYSSAEVIRSGVNGSVKLTSTSQLDYMGALIHMPFAQHPSGLTSEEAAENPAMANQGFVEAEAGKSITQGQSGLRYLLDTSAGLLTVAGYGIYRDLSNPLTFGIITVDRLAGGFRTTLDNQWGNLQLNVGAEAKFQNDDRTEFENAGGGVRGAVTVDQVEQVWNQALFATGTYSLQNFNILGSLRYDRLTFSTDAPSVENTGKRTFQAFSPSLGFNYDQGLVTFYSNLSTSFEAPTTTELVNRPDDGNGFNPELEPEKTVGLEIGMRGETADNILNYDVALFNLWIYDLLFPFQLESAETFFRNQGETVHSGIEAQLTIHPAHNWRWIVVGNVTRAEFKKATTPDGTSLRGNKVPGIPELRLNSSLVWNPGFFRSSASYEYISSYTTDNLNTSQNDKYSVVDAKISYQINFPGSNVTINPFLNVRNIFDKRYNGSIVVNAFGGRYYEPAPGRNWQTGISVQF